MKRFRDPNWVLIFLFLGITAAVPLIQILIEAREETGIRAFEVFNDWPTAVNLRAYERDLEKGAWAARLTRPWLQFAHFTWLREGGEKVVLGSPGWYFYKPGLRYMFTRPEEARAAVATNDPVAAIVNFRDQLAAYGIHLLVMPVPNKESIYPDRLSSRAENPRGVLAPRTRDVLERLRAASVEVVDLFKEFTEARRQSASKAEAPLYLAQDTHWSPAGVALAAKAATRQLTGLGWIQQGHIEYREKAASVQRLGDILRMMQAPVIERSLKPEGVSSVQVVRCDNAQLYQDEAEAEVLVLGDSFMRIYQTDEPNSAGFIAHLAKELKQPMMSLVNDGGGSTLVREELGSRPAFLKNKKVVLWEFVERDIGLGLKGWQQTRLPPAPPRVAGSVDASSGFRIGAPIL
ncbi:MAG TPA: hypothetical protein VGR78_03410 [Verrucomicrobiae bacterium]|nr:hypothetical protein [Verrucomicrobiae bacterium]